MRSLALCFVLLPFFVIPIARPQSPEPASPPPNTAKSSDAPADSKAGDTAEKKKPKKVWTNDEISSVKGGVSVVGDTDSSQPAPKRGEKGSAATKNAAGQREAQIDYYRERIKQYQAQIDAIDARVALLKNFHANNSESSGGINPYEGYNTVPIDDQIKQLEERKKQIQSRIDDTENEARKNGIEPGELR